MSETESLLDIVKTIPDYRNARGWIYTIESIRFCIVCGFMCGCYTAVDISDYIELNFDFFGGLPCCSLVKKGHGRIETYECHTLVDTSFLLECLPKGSSFNTIGSIAVIDKTTSAKTGGKWEETGRETMYYITDLTDCNPLTLLECKIDHWCIEASHWKLDVIMREDFQTARKENAGINMTIIRRLVMRIAQASGNPKDKKLKYFMKHCFKDNDFMLKCLLMSR